MARWSILADDSTLGYWLKTDTGINAFANIAKVDFINFYAVEYPDIVNIF
jgi:hypothetical protein